MKSRFTDRCRLELLGAAHWVQRHSRRLSFVLAALLLGAGGGALAVASWGPDASDLPVRQVTEALPLGQLQDQQQALEAHHFTLYRSATTRSSDTAEALLARLGLNDAAAAAYVRSTPLLRSQLLGRAGRSVSAEATDQHTLSKLTVRWLPPADESQASGVFNRLTVQRQGAAGFQTQLETAPLVANSRLGGGVIRSSLFAAVDDARLPDEVALQVADIFSGDIDFHRSLRKGDRFSVVYETLEADGEPLRTGRVLSADFVNNNKRYQALWFQEPGKKGSYYTLDGQSLSRRYLASPLEFSRVTSGFAMRFHPILQKWRAHLGVDYGAPTGTPVRTVGDGVVKFAGVQNGFGNVVMVQHGNGDTTVYAHLSRIFVRKGQAVEQGQRIAAVGSTGWATGPHLHFEFRVNGVHRDPLEIARASRGLELTAQSRPAFERVARESRLQLEAAARLAATAQVATAE